MSRIQNGISSRFSSQNSSQKNVYCIASLSGGRPGDERGGRVLDLHLVEQHVAVLGDLDIAGSGHEHLHGALWPEVGLEHVLNALRRGDVDREGLGGASHLGLGVQHGYRGHLEWYGGKVL